MSPEDLAKANKIAGYAIDDPRVLAALADCRNHASVPFSIFDWIVPPAYAGAATCIVPTAGGPMEISVGAAIGCYDAVMQALSVRSALRFAGDALPALLAADVFVETMFGSIGTNIDTTNKLSDGTIVRMTGNDDALQRIVSITTPDGDKVSLVLFQDPVSKQFLLDGGTFNGADMSRTLLQDMANGLATNGQNVVLSENAGMGHNGGPPLDDHGSNNGGDPNGKPPLVPPPVSGYDIDYDTISTAKPGQSTQPRNLEEQVLWNQIKGNPGSGEKLDLNNDPRFPPSNGWQKMQVSHELPDGSYITIHYQYNAITGKAYDMKFTN